VTSFPCGSGGFVSPGSTRGGRDTPERFIPATGSIDRLPELRGRFERILAVAQGKNPPPGHIQLADQLVRAVEAWQIDPEKT
jgi:hypothetical protein